MVLEYKLILFESILLALPYRTLEMLNIERAARIYIFLIFGYVRNLNQKGGSKWQSYQRDCREISNTCICLGILLFPKYRFSPDPAGLEIFLEEFIEEVTDTEV